MSKQLVCLCSAILFSSVLHPTAIHSTSQYTLLYCSAVLYCCIFHCIAQYRILEGAYCIALYRHWLPLYAIMSL